MNATIMATKSIFLLILPTPFLHSDQSLSCQTEMAEIFHDVSEIKCHLDEYKDISFDNINFY